MTLHIDDSWFLRSHAARSPIEGEIREEGCVAMSALFYRVLDLAHDDVTMLPSALVVTAAGSVRGMETQYFGRRQLRKCHG